MSTATPPGLFIPSAAAPPGAQPDYGDRRMSTLGTTCFVLAALEILYAFYKIGSSVLSVVMMQMSQSTAGGAGTPVDRSFEAMFDGMITIAVIDCGRMVPFIAGSIWLVLIGVRLRRGDLRALDQARLWSWCALAVVVLSTGLSIFGVVIMTQMQQQMFATSTGGGAAPMGGNFELVGLIMGLAGVIFGAAIMATWPVVLLVWVGKLRPAASVAGGQPPEPPVPPVPAS